MNRWDKLDHTVSSSEDRGKNNTSSKIRRSGSVLCLLLVVLLTGCGSDVKSEIMFLLRDGIVELLASGGIIAIIMGIAWWLGVTLTGGGILAVLAWLGAKSGGGFGCISSSLAGILALCFIYMMLRTLIGSLL